MCGSALDAGPCLTVIDKVYWDSVSGRCLNFTYGGCLGGPNRFSTVEECEEVCGNTGPGNMITLLDFSFERTSSLFPTRSHHKKSPRSEPFLSKFFTRDSCGWWYTRIYMRPRRRPCVPARRVVGHGRLWAVLAPLVLQHRQRRLPALRVRGLRWQRKQLPLLRGM